MGSCEVLIIRHGQSTWNAEGRWQGQADPPLSEFGMKQARSARNVFKELAPFDLLAASTLQRAAQTASLMAPDSDISTLDWLKERCAGPWQGLTRIQIEQDWPGYLKDGRRPAGYELDPEILDRVLEPFIRLCADYAGRKIALVSHGGIIGAIERSAGMQWGRIPNLAGRWLKVDGAELSPCEQVLLAHEQTSEDPQAI